MGVLITGAMGHVGGALVREAAAAGLRVKAQYRSRFDPALANAIEGDVA